MKGAIFKVFFLLLWRILFGGLSKCLSAAEKCGFWPFWGLNARKNSQIWGVRNRAEFVKCTRRFRSPQTRILPSTSYFRKIFTNFLFGKKHGRWSSIRKNVRLSTSQGRRTFIYYPYNLHGHQLNHVNQTKYNLGVTITSDFRWNTHIEVAELYSQQFVELLSSKYQCQRPH